MTNVDAAEIATFQKLAAEWWDPKGPMRALHHINPVRLNYIKRCAAGVAGKQVLDIGCGAGLVTEGLAAMAAKATGIDLATDALQAAQLHGLESGVKASYHASSAEDFAAAHSAQFDLVVCLEMLEHVPDPASVIAAAAALAKPGGTLVFSTINRTPKAFALAVVGAEYVLSLVPRGTHDYAKFIRPAELTAWARAAGLEPVEVMGLSYNPITRSASLGADIDINYFLHCKKP